MKEKLYRPEGLAMAALPVTRRDRVNNRARRIVDLGSVTGAQLLQAAGLKGEGPALFCGPREKALPVLRQLALQSGMPFLLVGTQLDLEEVCLRPLKPQWTRTAVPSTLPEGSGWLILEPGPLTALELKERMGDWRDRYVILFLGRGLQLDARDLDQVNRWRGCALVTESLHRSLQAAGEDCLSPGRLLASMTLVFWQSAGPNKELVESLPTFEQVKAVNTLDYSAFRHEAGDRGPDKSLRSSSLRLSQSRQLETKPLLTQDQVRRLRQENRLLVYDVAESRVWVAVLI